jgi:hypothetical protein
LFVEKAVLPQFNAEALEAAVQSILSVTGGDFMVQGELSVESMTDGIFLDAWIVLNRAAEASLDTFTGVTIKQKFAWLLAAAAVGSDGPPRLSAEQALLSGKSLQKQVDKVQKDLSVISSKAERACSAATKAAAGGSGFQAAAVLAGIRQTEQADMASIRSHTSITATNFIKLLQVDPKPEAAVAEVAVVAAGEPLRPGEKRDQEWSAARREKAEGQLSANRGIPRALAHELEEAGCAAVEDYLKRAGGVGVPTLGPGGAFVMSSTDYPHLVTTLCMGGELVSLTWEQALRHRLPTMLEYYARLASERKFALDEYKDVILDLRQLQREVKELAERNKQLERQLELRCTCGQVAEDSD